MLAVAGRFPGAATVEHYWKNLCDGVESVHHFSDDELRAAGEDPALLADPAYVRACPVLEDIDQFDAAFFGISPRDASVMDPQHRLFLEVAWEAMERAGYIGAAAPVATGVFAATGMNHYMLHHVVPNAEIMRTVGEWLARHNGNDMNFMATRAAYQLNLRGPALNVQTACSSSLTALHMACQSLLNGEIDLALVGASTLSLPQDRGYVHRAGEILSSDGHCRPFDRDATGTLFGSGVGCTVLKRLADALRDGDTIVAVICGTAINNDGAHKAGYLAPSVDGQARVLAEALSMSEVPAESIRLIEAHGTGTAVGDPIEFTALTQVYARPAVPTASIALGSVKGNIGHLGEAAGMAGFIKTVLALQHGVLPPTVNYSAPNPQIDIASSPFYINTQRTAWPRRAMPRRAAVTSLGVGGTNAHIILEEAPALSVDSPATRAAQLLTISAKTPSALVQATADLADALAATPTTVLANAAWTLQQGRVAFPYRRTVVARHLDDAVRALRESTSATRAVAVDASAPSVVFMFPGGGAQYTGMGRDLYDHEPAYREAFDACLAQMPAALAQTVRQLVLTASDDRATLNDPQFALPALFATEYATAQLLLAWGVTPSALIGHSMGEYVAACLAGVFTLSDALLLVLERARLFATLPCGAMLSVEMSEAELAPLLGAALSLAAVNGPTSCVASGPVNAIDALERTLHDRDVGTARVHINVAAHSTMLEPILAAFGEACARVRYAAPTLPFVSNVSGTWITPQNATDPQYWVRHLRHTVRFGDGVHTVLARGSAILVEVGPGRSLSNLASACAPAVAPISTLRHPRDAAVPDVDFLLRAVGRVWEQGGTVSWDVLHQGSPRQRILLPTYPFEHQSYWLPAGVHHTTPPLPRATSRVRRDDIRDWFATVAFRRSALTRPTLPALQGTWLVFADRGGVAEALAAQRGSARTIIVSIGDRFAKRTATHYTVRIDTPDDISAVFEAVRLDGDWPEQVVHLWALDTPDDSLVDRLRKPSAERRVYRALHTYYASVVAAVNAIAEHEQAMTLSTVARGLFACGDADYPLDPSKALLLGPTQVAAREVAHMRTRCIDIAVGTTTAATIAARLLDELPYPVDEAVLALRPGARWVRVLHATPLDAAPASLPRVRPQATVLITGGLGGLGLEIAEYFARTAQARLVLVSRTTMPPRDEWEHIARRGGAERVVEQVRRLLAIEAAGASVVTCAADVTDAEQMAGVLSMVRTTFGALHGIVHAAGTIHDGLMSTKPLAHASAVIAPKMLGAMVLDELIGEQPLDFCVVFSSISAVMGFEGQADYTAANAFLDAFAEHKQRTSRTRTLSIGWNAWREIGMTATLANAAVMRPVGDAGPHPELERVTTDADGSRVFSTLFSRARHWMVAEHALRTGETLLPGAAYLELARAACESDMGRRQLVLEQVTFLFPFVVNDAAPRPLRLRLAPAQGEMPRAFAFTPDASDDACVTGFVYAHDQLPLAVEPLPVVAARCGTARVIGGKLDQSFMDFGPRWGVVTSVAATNGEALVHLTLPPEFHADLATYRLHPALLDMGTGGAQALIPDFDQASDFYVPLRYESLQLFAPLTAELYSHVRYDAARSSRDTACFDIDLRSTNGDLLVAIRGFVMKRLRDGALASPLPLSAASTPTASASSVQGLLTTAITPREGIEAFDRLLASGLSGQLLASSVDLTQWSASLETTSHASAPASSSGHTSGTGFARPKVSAPYVAPRTPIEQELQALWADLLGVDDIGVHDDFFELGGQSLVAVRLFSRIRKRFRVDLPLSTLFDAPTIARCAAIIADDAQRGQGKPVHALDMSARHGAHRGAAEQEHTPSAIPAASSSRWRSLVVMQASGTRPAFVCVAGMGGTLTNLRELAALLGDERPFYGLQPPGADNPAALLYSVEALAAHYIDELRQHQPEGPYFLGGYSGGGVAAFEMARQLTASGARVAFLGLIDSFSPALPQRSWMERGVLHAKRTLTRGPGYLFDTVRRRVGSERSNVRLRMARQLGRVMPDVYRYDAIQDSWLVAERRYRPQPLTLGATLLRAREESAISLWTGVRVDSEHGWGRYLLGGVDVQICPGNHTTMCEEPNVRVLATRLRAAIDAADVALE